MNLHSIIAKSSGGGASGRRYRQEEDEQDEEEETSVFSSSTADNSTPSALLSSGSNASSAGGAGARSSQQQQQGESGGAGAGASTSGRSLFGEASITLNTIIESLPVPGRSGPSNNNSSAAAANRSSPSQPPPPPPPALPVDADDMSMLSLPSTMQEAQTTNDARMAKYRAKINDLITTHNAETRELRQTIDDLQRLNADLEERLHVLMDDVDDKHAMSDYAQFIVDRAPPSDGRADHNNSSYVLKLQSQLCKAMHKMGVLSNQVDLVRQQNEDAISALREKMMAQSTEHALMEQQSMNDLVDMERELARVRRAHAAEVQLLEEEIGRASRAAWKEGIDDLMMGMGSYEQGVAAAGTGASGTGTGMPRSSMLPSPAATSASASFDRSRPPSSLPLPYASMSSHAGQTAPQDQERRVHHQEADDSVARDCAMIFEDSDEDEDARSFDSDAATAISETTAQVSNVSTDDHYASRGRAPPPPPTSTVPLSGSKKSEKRQVNATSSSAVPPIHEQLVIQLQSKTKEVDELQKKLDEQAKIIARYELEKSAAASAADAARNADKKRDEASRRWREEPRPRPRPRTRKSEPAPASTIAAYSRRRDGRRGSSSLVEMYYQTSKEAREQQERGSRRAQSSPPSLPVAPIPSSVVLRGFDPTARSLRKRGSRRKDAAARPKQLQSGTADGPTVPLGQLPERKSSMAHVA